MSRLVALAFALAAAPALAQTPTLTCETGGAYRHCFDHHGYESTEERSPGVHTRLGLERPCVDHVGARRPHRDLADPVTTGPRARSRAPSRPRGLSDVPRGGTGLVPQKKPKDPAR